jgi:methionyl-tRNA formyltransferase
MKANIAAIFTLQDRFKNKIIAFREFDDLAQSCRIPLYKVDSLLSKENIRRIKEIAPDLIYVVSWSQLIPKEILDTPTLGCIGFHCSLLPKHRGRAPIPWSIIHGLRKSGMTMFYLTDGVDDGDIIGQIGFKISSIDEASDVYNKALKAAVGLMKRYHPLLERKIAPRIPQDNKKATYWMRRVPQDGLIDWNKSSCHIYDWVRALSHPFPGAFTYLNDKKIFIWKTQIYSSKHLILKPAVIRVDAKKSNIIAGCGEGNIALLRLQFENGQEKTSRDFLRQNNLSNGMVLG